MRWTTVTNDQHADQNFRFDLFRYDYSIVSVRDNLDAIFEPFHGLWGFRLSGGVADQLDCTGTVHKLGSGQLDVCIRIKIIQKRT